MKTYYLKQLCQSAKSNSLPASILSIGNFDGVHRGHQAMIHKLTNIAKQQNKQAMVMIFEPQPREFFATLSGQNKSTQNNALEQMPARLTSLAEKQALLAQYGVDILIVAEFDTAFRSLSAHDFAQLLQNTLNVTGLVLGDDFRFGHDRTGDSQFLRQYGLPVTNLDTVTDKDDNNSTSSNDRISSTRIRQCLLTGDLPTANRLLGRDYSITGTVLGGDKIGRTIDFPTANISLNRLKPALHGVFAVDVVMLDDDNNVITDGFDSCSKEEQTGLTGLREYSLFGTASIGTRPSVDKSHDWRLEVYFPQFSGDLYGKKLHVRFLHFLHGERHYPSLEVLQSAIKQDVQELLDWRLAQKQIK